jgi:hypothetical protein
MATSTVSMSDCFEFMIELAIPPLDTVAEELADVSPRANGISLMGSPCAAGYW